MECAICLQRCIHAVQLPCKHIFCFLCVKGASHQSKRCAMCRCEIPESYFDAPQLIEEVNEKDVPLYDDGYQWFYEGCNGWWIYDRRTSEDIESAYKKGQQKCELLIAGFLYVIDISRMIQYRRNEPNRMRRIKRDRPDDSVTKGIAGLRRPNHTDLCHESSVAPHNDGDSVTHDQETQSQRSYLRSQLVEQLRHENEHNGGDSETLNHNDSSVDHAFDETNDLHQILSHLTLNETHETYL